MKLSRMIAPQTLLWAVLALPSLLMPAFAQQEVDPTWYDPWAAAPKASHPLQAKAEQKKTARKVRVAAAGSKENQTTQARDHVPHRTQQATLQAALK